MVNQWLNKATVSQCDAQGLLTAIRAILDAPTLSQAGAQRFRSRRVAVDDLALATLLHHSLIREFTEFDTRIETFAVIDARNISAPDELKGIERQLKTMDVRRRHAKDGAQRNRILKSKTERWDDANRQQSLGKAHGELVARRHEIRMNQQEAENILSALTEDIDRDSQLRHGRWIAPVTIGLTSSLIFLFEELSELNSEHFTGRSLSDILNVGPLLG